MEFGDVRIKASIRTRARTTVPVDVDVRAAPVQLDCWDAVVTSNAFANVILLENMYTKAIFFAKVPQKHALLN